MNRTCPSKWRIKKPFITCTRAGAAKKAAGCGGEARGASLSYLEPFPVNLGPPFVVVLRIRTHTLARGAQRECTHARARACDGGLGPLPVRVRVRVRSTSHLAAKTHCASTIIIFLSPMHWRLWRIFVNSISAFKTRDEVSHKNIWHFEVMR